MIKKEFDSILYEIKTDLRNLVNLIENIKYDIEKLKKMRNKNGLKLANLIVQSGIGIIASILTGGISSAIFISSTCLNITSTIVTSINIGLINKHISKLNIILKNPENERKIIEDEIQKIKAKSKKMSKLCHIIFKMINKRQIYFIIKKLIS